MGLFGFCPANHVDFASPTEAFGSYSISTLKMSSFITTVLVALLRFVFLLDTTMANATVGLNLSEPNLLATLLSPCPFPRFLLRLYKTY
jgi:hypothetical protein